MKKGSGMRQLLAVLLAVWMAAAGALGAAAQEEKKQVAMSFTARSALLMEQQTGKVLFSQNETQRVAPASLTKLMDLLLIFQQLQSGKLTMEQELTCSAYAKTMGGSEIWLKEGERMTVEELLKALVVASANDAAVVFAEAIAASEEEFVRLMNEKAQQLGLQNTHFVNCTGFDEEGHYTCAQDVAVLARELMTGYGEQLTRFSTIWMDSLRGGETQLVNTNRLIRFYEGADGVKTGSTNEAKYCVSATAKRGDERFLAVVLGAPTGAKRFDLAGKLLNYAFENYYTKTFLVKGQVIDKQIPVSGALSRSISASALCDLSVLVKRGEEKNWTMEFNLPKCVRAPQRKGEVIGQAIALYCGERVTDVPIVLCEEIPKLGIPAIIREIFFRWL